ncbi:MAG: hypothetical protein ACFFCI_08845 [Promethearchaeota archaeon]
MNFSDTLRDFGSYNKKIWKKLILISILLVYFTFLIWYNLFNNYLSTGGITNLVRLSWRFGIIWASISTIFLVLAFDILFFNLSKRKAVGILALLMGLGGVVVLVLLFIGVFVTAAVLFPFMDLVIIIIGALAIVFGIIGITKDDSKGLGITGLILGIILEVVIWVVIPLLLIFTAYSGSL